MATEKQQKAAAVGALETGLSSSTLTTAMTLGAVNPLLGVGFALTAAATGGVQSFQEQQAKDLAKANKEAMKADKQAQKRAKQRTALSQQSKKDDALLAASMGGATTQANTGTQFDKFQAETFGVG
tara:strand:+ start:4623 stop:5000 length:378 start_codon:yes stop_codon:yes gene_type:complete